MALLLALGASLGHSGYEHMTAAKTLTGVDPDRSAYFFALGQSLGLDQYNPSWTNWDVPLTWKGQMSKGEGCACKQPRSPHVCPLVSPHNLLTPTCLCCRFHHAVLRRYVHSRHDGPHLH